MTTQSKKILFTNLVSFYLVENAVMSSIRDRLFDNQLAIDSEEFNSAYKHFKAQFKKIRASYKNDLTYEQFTKLEIAAHRVAYYY